MMRVSKMLGGLVAAAAAIVALTASTESRAGDEDLVNVTCKDGNVTATGKAPWHTNDKAPWKWTGGDKVKIDDHQATFKGAKCDGVVTAFVCNGDSCKGPIKVPVK